MLPKRAKPGWKPQTCLEDQTDTVRIKMLAEIVGLKGRVKLARLEAFVKVARFGSSQDRRAEKYICLSGR